MSADPRRVASPSGTGGPICTCYEAGRNPSCPSHGMTAGVVPDPPATRWINPPPDPPVAVPGPASVSPAEPPEWDYADVLAGPWYVAREPRDEYRIAIKSGPFTILTVSDYFDGGGPVEERLDWICAVVNLRLGDEAMGARDGR